MSETASFLEPDTSILENKLHFVKVCNYTIAMVFLMFFLLLLFFRLLCFYARSNNILHRTLIEIHFLYDDDFCILLCICVVLQNDLQDELDNMFRDIERKGESATADSSKLPYKIIKPVPGECGRCLYRQFSMRIVCVATVVFCIFFFFCMFVLLRNSVTRTCEQPPIYEPHTHVHIR